MARAVREMVGAVLTIAITIALLAMTPPTESMLAGASSQREADGDPTTIECPRTPAARTDRAHHDPPGFASPLEPCFCGLYQTTAESPAACVAMLDPAIALATWRRQRRAWRVVCAQLGPDAGARDLERCTIAGYARGRAGALAALGIARSRQGDAGVRYAAALLLRAALVRSPEHRRPLRASAPLW